MFIDLHIHNKETSLFRTMQVAQRGLVPRSERAIS